MPPSSNPPARETIVASLSSSEGGISLPLSSRILPSEVLEAWRVFRPLLEYLPETSPHSVSTVLGRLATYLARAGALETDNDAHQVRLARLEADARDWRHGCSHLVLTSSKRPRSVDPNDEDDWALVCGAALFLFLVIFNW